MKVKEARRGKKKTEVRREKEEDGMVGSNIPGRQSRLDVDRCTSLRAHRY